MAKIVHAPRLMDKTYMVSTPSGTSANWPSMRFQKVNTFPRKSGFHSEGDADYCLLQAAFFDKDMSDITSELLDITAHTKHLGIIYLDYILLNIKDFIKINTDGWLQDNVTTKELNYSNVLTKLISMNLIKRIKGESYNLPTILSRKFIDINIALEAYYKRQDELKKEFIYKRKEH